MVGVTSAPGTTLKGLSVRKAENCRRSRPCVLSGDTLRVPCSGSGCGLLMQLQQEVRARVEILVLVASKA